MLDRVRFGRTGLTVSRLALGGIPIQRVSRQEGARLVRDALELGINFIDTAHSYGYSEEVMGEGIASVPRDSVVVATKSPAPDKKTFLADLDESLRRLRTDYIDIFQMHHVSSKAKMDAVMGPGGAMEGMVEGIRAGKIRFPGFSSHTLRTAIEMIKTGRFDVVQIPFNFVDCQATDEMIPLAEAADMGIIAMKPLGGGLLEDARLCFRFLLQFPGVVPDPGVERIEQLREIVDVMQSTGPLSEDERAQMEAHRVRLGNEWCHRCDYCQPCPQQIPISTILMAKCFSVRMPKEKAMSFMAPAFKVAEDCQECGECSGRCPYHLDIPALLKKQRRFQDNYIATGRWE
jgi:uncharacterized protein